MKAITIIPTAGLCNRMRAMSSGIRIAHEVGVVPTVSWQKEKNVCNAAFSDLFLSIPEDIAIVADGRGRFRLRNWSGRRNVIQRQIQKLLYDQAIYNFNSLEKGEISSFLKPDTQSLLLNSCHRMGEYFDMQAMFRPIDLLESRIDGLSKDFTDKTVGVHIRRGDNAASIKHSPTGAFVRILDGLFSSGEADKIYLATDSLAVRKELTDRYGAAIIYQEESLSRNTSDGIRDAVVDLFCLSRTSKIIGSYYSSFSEIAAELGRKELIFAIDNDSTK